MKRKSWISLGLVGLISMSLILLSVWLTNNPSNNYPKAVLTYGILGEIKDLDPMVAWDEGSFALQDQVCEGLFGYNYSDEDMGIIPKLALEFGEWNLTGSLPTYTVLLRDDVWFHDGTKLNASAVKWNFDRLKYFKDNTLTKAGYLFEFYDTVSESNRDIINITEVIEEYKIIFILNTPYGAFESLLCFNAFYILSPSSTTFTEKINTYTGDLVGTGPFVYDGFLKYDDVRLHAWTEYWAQQASIETISFKMSSNPFNSLYNNEVDIITDSSAYWIGSVFCSCEHLRKNAIYSTQINYIGMNNYWLNLTFRKVISYIINYSYLTGYENSYKMPGDRLKSPIPRGIKYSNYSLNIAECNVTKARMLMQSMGYGITLDPTYPGSNESEWQHSILKIFNFSYPVGNPLGEFIFNHIKANLNLTGILLEDAGVEWSQIESSIYEINGFYRDMNQLYLMGWIPDLNDPNSYLTYLFTNRTVSFNGCKYNGYLAAQEAGRDPLNSWDNVQLLMEQAFSEINDTIRRNYFDRIQKLLIEEDFPCVLLYTNYNYDGWNKQLIGYPSNPMNKVCFYPCYWNNTV